MKAERGTPAPATGAAADKVRHTVVAFGFRMLLSTATGVMTARALHPEGRANYYIIVTIASIALILGELSIEQANVAFWSAARDAIPANSLVLGLLLGTASAVLIGALVAILGSTVLPVYSYFLLVIALASVPLSTVTIHLNNVALLLGRTEVVNRSAVLSAIVQCGALTALIGAGRLSVEAVIWIWTLANSIPLVVLLAALRPAIRRCDFSVARRMICLAVRYHLGVVALHLLFRTDLLILNMLRPGTSVGLYSLAWTLLNLTHVGTDAVAKVALRVQAEERLDRAAVLTARCIRMSIVVALSLVTTMCITAPLLVPLLYGVAFRGSVLPLLALAPGVFAIGATRSVRTYLLRLGRPWLMSGTAVVALIVNVVLNLLLIPRWGIVGCGVAASMSYLTVAGCQVALFAKATGTSPHTLLPGRAEVARLWSELRRLRRPLDRRRPPIERVSVSRVRGPAAHSGSDGLTVAEPSRETRLGPTRPPAHRAGDRGT